MSGDRGTSKGNIKTHLDELLCKSFVKIKAEDLYKNWYEISKRLGRKAKFDDEISPCSDHGDSKVKHLKLSKINEKISITNLEFVWLQGYVADITKDFDTFEISDNSCHKISSHHSGSTSTVFIVNCTNTPGGITSWSKGNYCQVLGQVLGIDKAHGHLRVSGIKVANLSNLANLEVLKGMWSNEVAEAHQIDNMKIL